MTAPVDLDDLRKRYPGQTTEAVRGVTLSVRDGEIFGVLGPNGAGKTTTVRMCTTLLRPTGGRARVAGHDVVKRPNEVRRRIGLVGQQNSLDNQLTVERGIYYHCRYSGIGRRESRRRTDEVIERLALTEVAGRMPLELSGGLAQRAMIARAIAHDPVVLFVDEPTTGLDPQIRLVVWDLIKELPRRGTTVLLTTHNLEEADQLCERVAIMRDGQLVACDNPGKLKALAQKENVFDVTLRSVSREFVAGILARPEVRAVEVLTVNSIRVRTERGERVLEDLLPVLTQSGLVELTVVKPSLEAVFLQLTRSDDDRPVEQVEECIA